MARWVKSVPGERPSSLAGNLAEGAAGNPRSRSGVAVSTLFWVATLVLLVAAAGEYALYAVDGLGFQAGLDSSEGLLWQQALWLFGPHSYGDIFHYPFVVFEYPPLYLLCVRLGGWLGLDMLLAGRLVSFAATLAFSMLVGRLTSEACRPSCGKLATRLGIAVAALLPFTLLTILSWSILMRVDMLALAFTWGGIVLGVAALRRPALLTPAVIAFVAAVFTKQIYVAAPVCMGVVWLIRSPRQAVRSYAAGAALGAGGVAVLAWLTGGGFVRHVFLYNVDRIDLAQAVRQTMMWLEAYPVLALLVPAAMAVLWRRTLPGRGSGTVLRLLDHIRGDRQAALLAFLTLYTALTTLMLISAGKTGASRNYFIEWMATWCVWAGWLAAIGVSADDGRGSWPPALRLLLPACLLLQLLPIPASIAMLRGQQFSDGHKRASAALLARVHDLKGPLLSDDMVMVIQSGREVGLEPGILLELARGGIWDEGNLVRMLDRHAFAGVITAYDPGDPTFDARYLPATQSAMLAAYPRIEAFGDYRLRLPAE